MTHSRNQSDASYGEWLAQHRDETARLTQSHRRIELLWSWGRLLAFWGIAVVWYLPVGGTVAWLATVFLLAEFYLAVRKHRAAKACREMGERELSMIDESQRRVGGKVVLIRDGSRPADPADIAAALEPNDSDGPNWELTGQECDDLDLFGTPVGLFGLLNRTSTGIGARRLRDMVENPCLSVDEIEARQDSVRRLQADGAQRIRIIAAMAVLRGQDAFLDRLVVGVRNAGPFPQRFKVTIYCVWSVISGLLMLGGLAMVGLGHYGWVYAMILLGFINSGIYIGLRQDLTRRIAPFKSLSMAVGGVLLVARRAECDLPDARNLSRLRNSLGEAANLAALARLGRIIPWADTAGMFHLLANFLFFYDLHIANSIADCVVPDRAPLLRGFAALAELDAYASLSAFAAELGSGDETCFPTLVRSRALSIVDGRHPLMNQAVSVPNDIELDDGVGMWVITGSNMAGKSTLLRMCGVNCLLAQIGTTVMARKMRMAPVRLVTDLQVRDALADGESYFLAEVRHLRRMVVPQEDDGLMLGLIDEPFRGTNSQEQVAAAIAVVEHLLKSEHLYIIATHEHQLAELAEQHAKSENRHFRENLGADGLVFDYHLQGGPATTRNALLVLEREGYPASVLERARDWLNRSLSREDAPSDADRQADFTSK